MLAAVLATAALLITQQTSGTDIVVEGKRMPEKRVFRRQVEAVAERVSNDTPLARFHDPVCIATTGLPSRVGVGILDRMIEVAEDVGIATAGEKCTPNVIVIFIDDGRDQVAALAKDNRRLLERLSGDEVKALLAQPGIVRAWGVTEIRSRDGDRLLHNQFGPPTLTVSSASRNVSPIRYDMLTSVLVIDRRAVPGKSVRQVADYAAMRAFARTRPPAKALVGTILSLFDETVATPPPDGMTDFDRGYLRALYHGRANSLPDMKEAGIARMIVEASGGRAK